MKKAIVLELVEMEKLGVDCGKTLAKVNNGDFDVDIKELEADYCGISDAVDCLISLTDIRLKGETR